MTLSLRIFLLCLTAPLVSCGTGGGAPSGAQQFDRTEINQLSEDRFTISVLAENVDGYELSRCVAAAFAESLRDDEGNRLYDFVERQGGQLTDTFRLKNGVRTQTTEGLQTFRLTNEGAHDGRDVMAVDLQLAECEQAGLAADVE